MADEVKQEKESGKALGLVIMVVLGVLTIIALFLILADLQGWR